VSVTLARYITPVSTKTRVSLQFLALRFRNKKRVRSRQLELVVSRCLVHRRDARLLPLRQL
jgi:hypothetical protein